MRKDTRSFLVTTLSVPAALTVIAFSHAALTPAVATSALTEPEPVATTSVVEAVPEAPAARPKPVATPAPVVTRTPTPPPVPTPAPVPAESVTVAPTPVTKTVTTHVSRRSRAS